MAKKTTTTPRQAATQAARLRGRKDAVLVSLPPFTDILRGSFFERTLRCGKPSCRCATGKGHRVAYVSVTFPGGRTQQLTVPRYLVPVVRRWIANYQRWRRAIEQVSAINRRLLHERLLPPPPTGSR
jgi:hypothetical protein